MYPKDLVEAVLEHSSILEVVSSYINVVKKGKGYVAICPFHDDTNPSMSVNVEKNIFKCFVCGEGGSPIKFVMKYEKLGFEAAVRKVAEICGYHDPRLLKETYVKPVDPTIAPIIACINDLQKYYVYALSIPEAEKARAYLEKRNIKEDQIAKYGIGYSPIDGESTIKYLQAKGHSLKAIEGTGIALAGANSRDHNAGRITFPLCDKDGQVVGFSARQLEKDGTSKYMNSPEGPLFHKGNILYNYHRARESSRRDGYCYMLEGFMDVMALDRAGIPNAIALMGTALTKEQVTLLKRLGCEIRLSLDGDDAGQTAMMKAIPLLQKEGVAIRLVSNPGDLRDPDDVLQEEGAGKLRLMMENLVSPFAFQLAFYTNTKKLETAEDKKKVIDHFVPTLASMPDGLEKDDWVAKLAKATGYETSAIYREIKRRSGPTEDESYYFGEEESAFEGKRKRGRYDKLFNAEKNMLHYMLTSIEAIAIFEERVQAFYNKTYETIANYLLDFVEKNKQMPKGNELLTQIEMDDPEDDTVGRALTSITMDEKQFPPFDRKAVETYGDLIKKEKEKAYRFNAMKAALEGKSETERGKIIGEYVDSVYRTDGEDAK